MVVGLVAKSTKMKAYIAFILAYALVNVIIAFYYIYQTYNNATFRSSYLPWIIITNTAIILVLLLPFFGKRKKIQPIA